MNETSQISPVDESKPSEIKFVINISCRLDIVKDYIKKTMIKLITSKIDEVALSIKPDNTFRLDVRFEIANHIKFHYLVTRRKKKIQQNQEILL